MSSLKSKFAIGAKHLGHQLNTPLIPTTACIKDVAYKSQYESPELVKDIIEGRLRARDDKNWRKSGARTKKEYEDWSGSVSGMACLYMILNHKNKAVAPIIKLAKKCLQYKGYVEPIQSSKGLQYYPFLKFIKKEFGMYGEVYRAMVQRDIKVALAGRNYVLASVHPQLHYPGVKPLRKGGHLILMVGYNDTKKEFYYHNPAGVTKETQEYAVIKYSDFKNFFANRGIVIKK